VRLERNERYWDAARTRNAIVDILPVASPNLALNLYDTHVADVIWDKDLVPVELLDVLIQRKDFHAYDYLGTYFYRFNVTRRPLDNAAVRKAFALATDREQLVKKLLSGGEKAAFHLVPNGVANYNAPPGIPYDPVEARKLLSQAGYPEGKGFPRLQFSYYAGSGGAGKMQAKLAVELQQMWQQNLGIIVELRQIERKIFYATQSRLDFDISASSWVGDYNDANTFLDLFTSNSGNNRTGWKSAEYDALLRQANEESSREKRAKLLQTAENLLIAEETPIVPVYFYKGFNFFDPGRIDGLYQNLLDEHPIQMLRKVR
jgi:oligopeptide transport system substrate-binding protein